MNKKVLLISLLMGGMFASCTSDDIIKETGVNLTSGEGFVSIAINLPTEQASTRGENDIFDDGLPTEYEVKNAMLLLFERSNSATSDDEAFFNSAYDLNLESWSKVGEQNDQISTRAQLIQKLKEKPASGKYYAFVILNHPIGFSVNGNNQLLVSGEIFSGQFKDLKELVITDEINRDDNGLLMSNSPLADKIGGSQNPERADISTLVEIDSNHIYTNEEEAEANPASEIYVERAAVKVTINGVTEGTTSEDGAVYEITGWAIDNFNTDSYLSRVLKDGTNNIEDYFPLYSRLTNTPNPYRFVGHTAIDNQAYRIYWTLDKNYDRDVTSGELGKYTELSNKFGDENPQYCYENTFDVERQTKINTTRVVFSAQFNGGEDFYVVNGVTSTLYSRGDVISYLKNRLFDYMNFKAWVQENAQSGTLTADDVTIDLDDTSAGSVSATAITIFGDKLQTDAATDELTTYADYLNNVYKLEYYSDGNAYYSVLIKHFGDALTPWTSDKLGNTLDDIYPNTDGFRNVNYLGRYGVVRNNWYELYISGINKIGHPTVPEIVINPDDDMPEYDDEGDNFISVQINILSWAKRTQQVAL